MFAITAAVVGSRRDIPWWAFLVEGLLGNTAEQRSIETKPGASAIVPAANRRGHPTVWRPPDAAPYA